MGGWDWFTGKRRKPQKESTEIHLIIYVMLRHAVPYVCTFYPCDGPVRPITESRIGAEFAKPFENDQV